MSEIIKEGKTVELAIAEALAELKTTKERVDIEILQEPSKGIFGADKVAKIRVKLKKEAETFPKHQEDKITKGKDFLEKVIIAMGILDAKIQVREEKEEQKIVFDIYSEDRGILIGKQGQTLFALQYLLNRVLTDITEEKNKYIIDIANYRKRHKIMLEKMAKNIAQRVLEKKEPEELKDMSAFDRRVIHVFFQDHPHLKTYSVGEGVQRKIIIAPK